MAGPVEQDYLKRTMEMAVENIGMEAIIAIVRRLRALGRSVPAEYERIK